MKSDQDQDSINNEEVGQGLYGGQLILSIIKLYIWIAHLLSPLIKWFHGVGREKCFLETGKKCSAWRATAIFLLLCNSQKKVFKIEKKSKGTLKTLFIDYSAAIFAFSLFSSLPMKLDFFWQHFTDSWGQLRIIQAYQSSVISRYTHFLLLVVAIWYCLANN